MKGATGSGALTGTACLWSRSEAKSNCNVKSGGRGRPPYMIFKYKTSRLSGRFCGGGRPGVEPDRPKSLRLHRLILICRRLVLIGRHCITWGCLGCSGRTGRRGWRRADRQLLQVVLQQADFHAAAGGVFRLSFFRDRSVAHAYHIDAVDRNLMIEHQVADDRVGHLLRSSNRRLAAAGGEALHLDDVAMLILQRSSHFIERVLGLLA